MGWASAGAIFDPVAQTLIDLRADAATKRALLTILIDKLRDGDWDTWDESLTTFRADPATVSAFYTACDGIEFQDDNGWIGYDADDRVWIVRCQACGNELCVADAVLDHPQQSAEEHNGLLDVWAEHDRDEHGGTGEVPDWVRIGGVG